MVSKLYPAKEFYERQKKGKIAVPYDNNQKLQKDNKGFYLYRSNRGGDIFKQRVNNDDKLYTRSETGVTKYNEERDRDIPAKTILKGTPHETAPYRHMGDREAKSTDRIYKT